jgi:hypothetical protein
MSFLTSKGEGKVACNSPTLKRMIGSSREIVIEVYYSKIQVKAIYVECEHMYWIGKHVIISIPVGSISLVQFKAKFTLKENLDLWIFGCKGSTKNNSLSNSMNYLWIFEVKYYRAQYVLIDSFHFCLVISDYRYLIKSCTLFDCTSWK